MKIRLLPNSLYIPLPTRSQGIRSLKLMLLACFFILILPFGASAQIITTVAGDRELGFNGDGPAVEAELFEPVSIAFDNEGNYYIADYRNFIVRKVDIQQGTINTIAGIPQTAGDTLGSCAATIAAIGGPTGIAVDKYGNVYIADYDNQFVRKVNAVTGIMTIAAGIGVAGYDGDSLAATQAELNYPQSVAVDGIGNLYISDNGNNVIRKVDTSGIITTYAGSQLGSAGYSGDGGAPTAATLYSPTGLFVDGPGNLYIADQGNNVIRIVYAGAGGIINTVAGNGVAGYSGDGGPATAGELNDPTGVSIDAQGNLFIAEYGNETIRKVNTWGSISTIAGCDTSIGYSGDGGPATAAVLNGPIGLAFDRFGDLYIADKFNSVVRRIIGESGVGIAKVTVANNRITLFPNPNTGIFTVRGALNSGADQNVSLEITDMLGRAIFTQAIVAHKGMINTQVAPGYLANGMYMLHILSETENDISSFMVENP